MYLSKIKKEKNIILDKFLNKYLYAKAISKLIAVTLSKFDELNSDYMQISRDKIF